jgi:Sulfotransferase domain
MNKITPATVRHQKLLEKTHADDIFLVTYPKSGTTWMRFLIGNYLTGNQCNYSNLYSIMPGLHVSDQESSNWCKFQPRFIQSHFPFTPDYRKVVYVVRDGRDVAVSFYFHLIKHWHLDIETPFSEFLVQFNGGSFAHKTPWADHVLNWLDNSPSDFLLVRYEDLQDNAAVELTKVLEFAGLSVDSDAVQSALEFSSFERLQQYEKYQFHLSNSPLALSDSSIQFMRKGQVGDWRNYFTEELLEQFMQVHGKALERLGYLSDDRRNAKSINHNSPPKIFPSLNLSLNHPKFAPEKNVILAGLPRSGTTLSCYLLDKLPNLVVNNEPVVKIATEVLPLNTRQRLDYVVNLLLDIRTQILQHKRIISESNYESEELITNSFSDDLGENGYRIRTASYGGRKIYKDIPSDFTLVVKKPALFTGILELLVDNFRVYAIIRNPLSVISSWQTIETIKYHKWALGGLDVKLTKRLESINDLTERQIYLLSWYYEKYYQLLPPTSIIRYEDIIASGGKALCAIAPEAKNLHEPLESKNLNPLYDREQMQVLGEKLLNYDEGAFWHFYDRDSVEALLQECRGESPSESSDKQNRNPESLIEEAVKQLNVNNNSKALTLIDRVLSISPQRIELNYGKAIALARLGRDSEAVNSLKQLLDAMPEHKKARILLHQII